jgi:2-keto-4-pentenoate hydratase/2-oxohepta-3-ene-1,7-dioic acid hydratase in catechol pathway
MEIVRFLDAHGHERLGCALHESSAELVAGPPLGPWEPTGRRARVARLLAPVAPVNIYGVGLNYRGHARRIGADLPERPPVFMKPTSTVVGPGAPIRIPAIGPERAEVDYECELAVVIGRPARDVPATEAIACVLGYTVANDVTARAWARISQTRGKGFDSFCPIGPVLVTADQIPDPQVLALRTTLNGEVVQDASTADMIFPVAEIVSYLSRDTTLLPGTLILTGTPPGSGVTHTPPRFLEDGDEVRCEVLGVGTLANPVRDARLPKRAAA